MAYIIGITMLLAANVAIVCGYMAHWKRIVTDIIAEEKRKAHEEAAAEIEYLADQRVREILSSIQYSKRIQLINESDINWGEK